jgi:Uma2 family endonuclease
MASCLLLEHNVEVPLDALSLDGFRHWARSEEFPESGRIDFINGNIEVDMSAEDAYTHGTPKTAIVARLWTIVDENKLGDIFSDRMRLSSPPANLSCEPDVLFISHESRDRGHVRLVEKSDSSRGSYVELEGAADIAVEIVSKSSVKKDTKRLPKAYFKAGVREFWLVDARREELVFIMHQRGRDGFEAVPADDEGFQRSEVLKQSFRLDRERDRPDHVRYNLRVKD